MKKLLLISALLLLTLFSGCSQPPGQEPEAPNPEETTSTESRILNVGIICGAETVNVRQTPSMDGEILNTVQRGQMFTVLEKEVLDEEKESWVKIAYQGNNAYVHSDYVHQVIWPSDATVQVGAVLTEDGAVYAAPAADSEVLYKTFSGEGMILYNTEDAAWYKVFLPNGDGFIPASAVAIETVSLKDRLNQ